IGDIESEYLSRTGRWAVGPHHARTNGAGARATGLCPAPAPGWSLGFRPMADSCSRRSFLKVAAIVPATAHVPFHVPPRRRAALPAAVSSANGLKSVE